MAQDEDLDLFGGVGAGVEHQPAQQLREHLIDQLQRPPVDHARPLPATNRQINGYVQTFGHPQGCSRVASANRWTSEPSFSSADDPMAETSRRRESGTRTTSPHFGGGAEMLTKTWRSTCSSTRSAARPPRSSPRSSAKRTGTTATCCWSGSYPNSGCSASARPPPRWSSAAGP